MQRVSKAERIVRRLAYVAGVVGPFTALPQAVSIWTTHQAAGVSIWSAACFTTIAGVWLAYAAILRQGPLLLSSFLWIILDLVIVSGVWRYGGS